MRTTQVGRSDGCKPQESCNTLLPCRILKSAQDAWTETHFITCFTYQGKKANENIPWSLQVFSRYYEMPLHCSAARWKCCYYLLLTIWWEEILLRAAGVLLSLVTFPPESITPLAIISCCRFSLHLRCLLSKPSVNCDQTCCLLQSTKLNLMPSNPGRQAAGSSSWGSQFQSLQPPNIFKVSCALHRSTHGLLLRKVHQQFSNILCSEGEKKIIRDAYLSFARQFCIAIYIHFPFLKKMNDLTK